LLKAVSEMACGLGFAWHAAKRQSAENNKRRGLIKNLIYAKLAKKEKNCPKM
jgi:hypothetical protein